MSSIDDPQIDNGFTLIEVLAALAIFSFAAIGMMRVTTENTSAIHRIETRMLARIVADNRINETLVSTNRLERGEITGIEDLGGRKWRWTQNISSTPNPLIIQVTVKVHEINRDPKPTDQHAGVDAEISAYESVH